MTRAALAAARTQTFSYESGERRCPGEAGRKLRRRLRRRLGARNGFGDAGRQEGNGAADDGTWLCAAVRQRQIVAAADVARSWRTNRRPRVPVSDYRTITGMRVGRTFV